MRFVQVGARKVEYYKGIDQGGFTGHHEQAARLLLKLAPPPRRALDIGAWQGAFSLRLADLGYQVEATDLDPSQFRPSSSITCSRLDLNNVNAMERLLEEKRGTFDVVCAMEIIEHIRASWQFLDFCRALLKPSGYLLLSTPNITSFYSRVGFFRLGQFHQFHPGEEINPGHINPLSALQLEIMFRELKLTVVRKEPVGSLPVLWLQRDLKFMLQWAIAAAMAPLMAGDRDGWCLMYLLRKDE